MSADYVSLLQQDEVWVDARGETHRLEDMDWKHRSNIIPFLRRSARALHLQAEYRYFGSSLANVENPSDGVWGAQEAAEQQLDMEPEDWLERTPLMRKLVELERGIPLARRKALAARNKLYEAATGYKKARLAPQLDP